MHAPGTTDSDVCKMRNLVCYQRIPIICMSTIVYKEDLGLMVCKVLRNDWGFVANRKQSGNIGDQFLGNQVYRLIVQQAPVLGTGCP